MGLTGIEMPSCQGKSRDLTDVAFMPDNTGVEMEKCRKANQDVTEVHHVKTTIRRPAQLGAKQAFLSCRSCNGEPNLFHFILKLCVSRRVSALPAFVVASNGPPPSD